MPQQLFVKEGRKYRPITPTDGWNGFPMDGIWLVKSDSSSKSSSCIMKIGDVPELFPFAQMMISRDQLSKFLMETMSSNSGAGISMQDLATEIIKFLAMNSKSKFDVLVESEGERTT